MLPLVSSMTTTVIGWTSFSKKIERLRLVVVEDLEVVLHEVGHQALLRVGDRREQRHDLGAGLERRLLRGKRGQGQAEGERPTIAAVFRMSFSLAHTRHARDRSRVTRPPQWRLDRSDLREVN